MVKDAVRQLIRQRIEDGLRPRDRTASWHGSGFGQICDGCGLPIKICRVDHVIPAGMGGKSTLDNARILGPCCWPEIDAKANRLVKYAAKPEEIRLGVKRHKRQFIKSRGFPPRAPKPSPCAPTSKTLPRRGI